MALQRVTTERGVKTRFGECMAEDAADRASADSRSVFITRCENAPQKAPKFPDCDWIAAITNGRQ